MIRRVPNSLSIRSLLREVPTYGVIAYVYSYETVRYLFRERKVEVFFSQHVCSRGTSDRHWRLFTFIILPSPVNLMLPWTGFERFKRLLPSSVKSRLTTFHVHITPHPLRIHSLYFRTVYLTCLLSPGVRSPLTYFHVRNTPHYPFYDYFCIVHPARLLSPSCRSRLTISHTQLPPTTYNNTDTYNWCT